MVAPIDAKATFTVDGEAFTLRLNFRALALAKAAGVNLIGVTSLDPLDIAIAVRCLAAQEHPDLTDDIAFALVVRDGEAVSKAIADLFEQFGGGTGGKSKAAAKRAA